jgi:hypothetical protein
MKDASVKGAVTDVFGRTDTQVILALGRAAA